MKPELTIYDTSFRRAVDLLDTGDAEGLRAYLNDNPAIIRQRVSLEGPNYFRHPALLAFTAENPIRIGSLPGNIVLLTKIILEAGAQTDQSMLDETLTLVCSGRVPRECGVQLHLLNLLCESGANPNTAMSAALIHGEFEAVHELIRQGARTSLPVAAALGRTEKAEHLLAAAISEERHSALALAAQFGHTSIVRLLLDACENPDRYNPPGTHSHSTPLHQAALAGHLEIVRLLVERGARLDQKDTLFQGTPADWAEHAGNTEIVNYLGRQEGVTN